LWKHYEKYYDNGKDDTDHHFSGVLVDWEAEEGSHFEGAVHQLIKLKFEIKLKLG
jgi:hypothetical protein